MKTLIHALLLSVAGLCLATAAQVGVRWNPNPVEDQVIKYTVTYGTPGPDGSMVWQTVDAVAPEAGGEVPTRVTLPALEEGKTYTLTVKAANAFGESEPSDPLVYTVPKRPAKPTGLQVVEVSVSNNLKDWQPLAYVPLRTAEPQRFVRAALTEIDLTP